MGIKEQLIFPEINYDKVETIKGMNIVFTTTAKTDEEAAALLELLGMPFGKTQCRPKEVLSNFLGKGNYRRNREWQDISQSKTG